MAIILERVTLSSFFRCSIIASVSKSTHPAASFDRGFSACLNCCGWFLTALSLSAVSSALNGWAEAMFKVENLNLSCHNGASVSLIPVSLKSTCGFAVFNETHHAVFLLTFLLKLSNNLVWKYFLNILEALCR